jgi:3,4-dihydroxy 2-butanone 4-phosphate synthase/GTP cyclohydrolase II
VPDLLKFAEKFKLKIGTIADLIEYRLQRETLVKEVKVLDGGVIPKGWILRVFESQLDGWQHLVYQKGVITHEAVPLVRVQQDDYLRLVRDILGSHKTSVAQAFEKFGNESHGLILILRGFEREPKVLSRLQSSLSLSVMDNRDYGLGAQILRTCGVQKFRLLTNSPEKRVGLKSFGLELVEIVSLGT